MERDAEVDRLKGELAILQARYDQYRRAAGTLKTFFRAVTPLLALGALAIAVKLSLSDAFYGLVLVGALLIFVPASVWLINSSGFRWIDLASQPPRGIYMRDYSGIDIGLRRSVRSDAELLEQQIAARERRLAELGEPVSGSKAD